jgi:protein TonB
VSASVATMSLLRPRPSGVLPFVLGSVVAHLLVTFGGLALSWAFAGPKVNLDPTPIKASLVQRGKPRDEKLLPTREQEPPPAPKAEPVAVKPPTPDTAVMVPSKDAVKPDKSASAKDTAKDPRKSLSDAFGKISKPREAEGAEDGDPNGDSTKQEGERYFGLLKSVVQKNYDVSSTIPEAERRMLNAQVSLWIGAGGEVLDVKLSRPSGNEVFDAAVLAAVKRASPFSPPPQHLREGLKKDGVGFVFRAVD